MKENEFVRAVKHSVWDWPVVLHISASSAAAGFYLLSFLLSLRPDNMESQLLDTMFKLTAPGLVGLGFFFVAIESGKPFKAKYLLHNMHTSWMSREVFFAITFFCLTLIDSKFPHPMIKSLAGVIAICLLLSQGFMIKRSCAVTAWNTLITPFYFFFSGMYIGFGCLLMWPLAIGPPQSLPLIIIGLIILVLNFALWIAYLNHSADTSFQQATRNLRRPLRMINTIGLGHCLPAMLLLIFIKTTPSGSTFKIPNTLSVLIGAIIICGGIYRNSAFFLIANYFKKLSADVLKRNAYHAEMPKSR